MDEKMVIKIVFGVLLTVGAFVLIFVAFKFFYKYLIQEKRCTKKTKGTVKKYAQTPGNGIYLPKVYYSVEGKEYEVIGPRYRAFITKSSSSPVGGNTMSGVFEDEKQRLVIKRGTNSLVSVRENPMAKLYPKGSEIDVFYNPTNPKLAYVLRYCNLKWIFWLTFTSGIACLLINALILVLI